MYQFTAIFLIDDDGEQCDDEGSGKENDDRNENDDYLSVGKNKPRKPRKPKSKKPKGKALHVRTNKGLYY